MANTKTLDLPTKGVPALTIYDETPSGVVVNTTLLDNPNYGLPAEYIYNVTSGTISSSTTIKPLRTLLGVGA